MDQQDEANGSRGSCRKILKPYRHLFSKPIAVKRTEPMPVDGAPDKRTYHSGTQTSKTILELARLDGGGGGGGGKVVRERSISPDSLSASPPSRRCGADDGGGGWAGSRTVSEADTIALVRKESAFDLRHVTVAKKQLEDNDNFDDFDEYTPEGSVYSPTKNCNNAQNAPYNHKSVLSTNNNPLPNQQAQIQHTSNNMAGKHYVYPPLYDRPYIVANAQVSTNHGDESYRLDQQPLVAIAHELNDAQQEQVVSSDAVAVLPDPSATATAFLIQQQQLEHTLVDSIFGGNSLVNTFFAKSKNRLRYSGDQPDHKTKKRGGSFNRQQNSYNLKSRSYIDSTSSPAHHSPHISAPQNYPNRTKFTLNECPGQPSNYHHQHHHPPPSDNCLVGNNQMAIEGDVVYGNYIVPAKATTTAVSGSKTAVGQRRSNSFMMPTIASERRSCMQEVRKITRLLSPTMRGCSLSPHLASNNQSQPFGAQSGNNGQYQQQGGQLYQQQQQDQQFYRYQQQMNQHLQKQIQSYHDMKVPYIDGSVCDDDAINEQRNKIYKEKMRDYSPVNIRPITPKNTFEEDLLKIDQLSLDVKNSQEGNSTGRNSTSGTSIDSTINNVLSRIKNEDWNIALKGLAEVTELCRSTDAAVMSPHMTAVNQRLLDLLRSPRSHVCRTACQAAGHLFESMKDTRKPEFEDIVNTLLHKTADSNKFIRQDANLALDCMVTHISSFHAIKALCSKGPTHKNPLVRCATIRLIICAVVIAGPETILNPTNSDYTRKRVIVHLAKFIIDKNLDTRKYAERLFKVLNRERSFDVCVKKFLEKEDLELFKQNIKYMKK